eukprot:scaffold7258_cov122-Isochrysis_galbana.AAC.4
MIGRKIVSAAVASRASSMSDRRSTNSRHDMCSVESKVLSSACASAANNACKGAGPSPPGARCVDHAVVASTLIPSCTASPSHS